MVKNKLHSHPSQLEVPRSCIQAESTICIKLYLSAHSF